MSQSKTIKPASLNVIALVLMLELLHLGLWFDFGSSLSKSLFLAHFGFFLIWQPIWQQNKRFTLLNTSAFVTAIFIFVYWLNLWLILVWLILLVGFIGGIFKQKRSEHFIYMLTLIFLISEILIGCNTQIFNIELNQTEDKIFSYGMLYIPLLLFFFKPEEDKDRISVDLLRAVSSALLISLLTLGSLLIMYHNGTSYFIALIQSTLSIALSLVVISWLLSPKLGFSGLSQLWYQSLLNIGTPFEKWLNDLYSINQRIDSPDIFIEEAMQELNTLNWVSGVAWELPHIKNKAGEESNFTIPIKINNLKVTLHTRILAGGALILHSRLLIRLIENMYSAKVQGHKLAQQAHLKNIHETGARITHDIKNLLQSLNTMTAMYSKETIETDKKEQIITKQIPNVSQRLQLALNKLSLPDGTKEFTLAPISKWSQNLKDRLDNTKLEIQTNINIDHQIPTSMFDSVLDNLLENAYYKQQLDNNIKISIRINSNEHEISVHFADTGKAIQQEIANKLLHEVIHSETGHGIGLYQTAKQAAKYDYGLNLISNVDGWVEFVLKTNLAER